MPGVDLDAVEAGAARALGGVGEPAADVLDVLLGHHVQRERLVGWVNGSLTAAISSGESASKRSPGFSGSSLGTQSGRPAITSWSEVLPACWSWTAIAAPCAWTRSVSVAERRHELVARETHVVRIRDARRPRHARDARR